jgi:putative transposase
VTEPAMIISMPTIARSQQRYDHRLRNLVQRIVDVTVATDLGVPRSTARGWLGETPTVVVCMDVTELTEPEPRHEVVKLRRRVRKLTALLRLALALLQTSGFCLTVARLPDGRDKLRSLRAVDRAREYLPWRALLRFLRVSPSWFHAWSRRQRSCVLDDQSSCPRMSPSRLTPSEVGGDQGPGHLARISSRADRHARSPRPAARQGLGLALYWYRLVRQNGWRRPRLRVHPAHK